MGYHTLTQALVYREDITAIKYIENVIAPYMESIRCLLITYHCHTLLHVQVPVSFAFITYPCMHADNSYLLFKKLLWADTLYIGIVKC